MRIYVYIFFLKEKAKEVKREKKGVKRGKKKGKQLSNGIESKQNWVKNIHRCIRNISTLARRRKTCRGSW